MRSGLRGGKPRDMATFKKGGISRGAGASKKGFDYAIYKKGGKVKKYQEGGALPERDPQTGTRQYASFSDWMKDLKREFGGKSEKAEAPRATSNRIQREDLPAPSPGAFDPDRQAAMDREEASRRRAAAPVEDRETRRPDPASESLPTAQQARMRRRRAAGPEFLPTDQAVTGPSRSRIPRPMSEEERAAEQPALSPRPRTNVPSVVRRPRSAPRSLEERIDDMRTENMYSGVYYGAPGQSMSLRTKEGVYVPVYRKGGGVKMAGGGSCRGMGAAQRGGKYTIK